MWAWSLCGLTSLSAQGMAAGDELVPAEPLTLTVSGGARCHGAWTLTARGKARFGAISAISVVDTSPPEFVAFSDEGQVLGFSLALDEEGTLQGIRRTGGPRPQPEVARGVESVASLESGSLLAFEGGSRGHPRLALLGSGASKTRDVHLDEALRKEMTAQVAFEDQGFEAMAALDASTVLMIAQRHADPERYLRCPAWVLRIQLSEEGDRGMSAIETSFPRRGVQIQLTAKSLPRNLEAKGATTLPRSRDVLVLEGFTWIHSEPHQGFFGLRRLEAGAVAKVRSEGGAFPTGETIDFGPAGKQPNYEAIASWSFDATRAYILIVSDDNLDPEVDCSVALLSVPDRADDGQSAAEEEGED